MNQPLGRKEKALKWHRFGGAVFYGGRMPDILMTAALAYREVCKRQYLYTFDNGECIRIVFKPQNFVHLAGLRKLGDVYEFSNNNTTTNIYNAILRGKITLLDAQQSIHYDTEARERIENLARLDELLQTDCVVWNFDREKVKFRTNLKSTVIFFREEGFNFYLLLGVAPDAKTYYPETFFLRFDDAYLRGQTVVQVISCKRKFYYE